MSRPHTPLRALAPAALALLALGAAAPPAAALPEASPVTPALVEAAKKEGKVVFYTAVDVEVAEKVAAAFRAKYPGIEIQVERSGSERLFQRVGAGIRQQHPQRRRDQHLGFRALPPLEARGPARALRAGGRRPSISATTPTPTGSTRPGGRRSRPSPTTPNSSSPPTRRRASPTSSTRNGRA